MTQRYSLKCFDQNVGRHANHAVICGSIIVSRLCEFGLNLSAVSGYFAILSAVKVTLLSAPLSSESPFCITTLLREQLISSILFGLAKSGKKEVVLHSLGNRKICRSQDFR